MIFDQQIIELSINQPMTADFESQYFDISGFDCGSMVVNWTGANAATAILIPQFSIDLSCWCNYVSEPNAQRVDSGTGCKMYEFSTYCFKYVRLRFLAKTNTAGIITTKVFSKRWYDNR